MEKTCSNCGEILITKQVLSDDGEIAACVLCFEPVEDDRDVLARYKAEYFAYIYDDV